MFFCSRPSAHARGVRGADGRSRFRRRSFDVARSRFVAVLRAPDGEHEGVPPADRLADLETELLLGISDHHESDGGLLDLRHGLLRPAQYDDLRSVAAGLQEVRGIAQPASKIRILDRILTGGDADGEGQVSSHQAVRNVQRWLLKGLLSSKTKVSEWTLHYGTLNFFCQCYPQNSG